MTSLKITLGRVRAKRTMVLDIQSGVRPLVQPMRRAASAGSNVICVAAELRGTDDQELRLPLPANDNLLPYQD